MNAREECPEERRTVRAVDVVVSVHQKLFPVGNGSDNAFNGEVHAVHEERVMKVLKARAEERFRLLERINASPDENLGEDRGDRELITESLDLLHVRN